MPEIMAEYAPFPDMAGRIGCLMLPIRGEANGRLAVFVQRGEGGVIALPVDMRFDRQGSIVLGDDEGVTESPTVERFVLLSACLAADALESMEAGLTPRLGKGSLDHPLVTLDEPPRSAAASEQMHLGWLAIADGTREFYGVIPMLTPANPIKTLGLHRKMVEQAIRASRTAIRDATGRDPGDLPALVEFMLDSETPGNPENFFPMSLVSWAGYEVVGIARSPGGQVTWRGFADLLPDHGNDVQEELQSWLRERRNEFGQELASAPRPGHS